MEVSCARCSQASVDVVAPRSGMTSLFEVVQWYFPSASPGDVDDLLWGFTAHPACGLEHTISQLRELAAEVFPEVAGWRERLERVRSENYEHLERCAMLMGPKDEEWVSSNEPSPTWRVDEGGEIIPNSIVEIPGRD